MIIDDKGRIFGRVNIVDLAIIAILVLAVFIAMKFVFFRPDYIHYKNATILVNFTNLPITSLYPLKIGKSYLYTENESYNTIDRDGYAECDNEKNGIKLVYYFNKTYVISADTLLVNCSYDTKHSSKVYRFDKATLNLTDMVPLKCEWDSTKSSPDANHDDIVYYFNNSYLPFLDKYLFKCYYDENRISIVHYFDDHALLPPEVKSVYCTYEVINDAFDYQKYKNLKDLDFDDSICDIRFMFKIKARIVDDKPFYDYNYYPLLKEGYFDARIGNTTLSNGIIIAVYES